MKTFCKMMIIINLFFISPLLYANDDDYMEGWKPTFYDSSVQEGRNLCLGLILGDNSQPGLDNSYSAGRWEPYDKNPVIFFENKTFYPEDAIAKIKFKFPLSDEKYNLYLFLLIDECIKDGDETFTYGLYDKDTVPDNFPDGTSMAGISIEYKKSGEDCVEIDENTCSTMDLTEFNNMETGWPDDDDDQTPTVDDDDDNNDNNDEGKCGGCASAGRGVSFPLALGMFFIGLVAWCVARRRSER